MMVVINSFQIPCLCWELEREASSILLLPLTCEATNTPGKERKTFLRPCTFCTFCTIVLVLTCEDTNTPGKEGKHGRFFTPPYFLYSSTFGKQGKCYQFLYHCTLSFEVFEKTKASKRWAEVYSEVYYFWGMKHRFWEIPKMWKVAKKHKNSFWQWLFSMTWVMSILFCYSIIICKCEPNYKLQLQITVQLNEQFG